MVIILIFIVATLINVILGTARSILTIKASRNVACIINAISFTFYAGVVKMITSQEMWLVLLVTFICNLIGVQIALIIIEKFTKDKLWKIEVTVLYDYQWQIRDIIEFKRIPYTYTILDDYVVFNFYSQSQKESLEIKKLLKGYDAKYFVTESKNL